MIWEHRSRTRLRVGGTPLAWLLLLTALGCGNSDHKQEATPSPPPTSDATTTGFEPGGGPECPFGSQCTPDPCAEDDCAAPDCSDQLLNGSEVDVDCGGDCAPCNIGAACSEAPDCETSVCQDGICAEASCDDGVLNGTEVDVDCGGDCELCTDGATCTESEHCLSGACRDGACQQPTCSDMVRNGVETDSDCGGDCTPCSVGKACASPGDCDTDICVEGACSTPECTDGLLSGDESDLDCGGPTCAGCASGRDCSAESDCSSGVCEADICAEPSCDDNVVNGTESDADCGGECDPCSDGGLCAQATDCTSGVCSRTCQSPSCGDSVHNGAETDVDCGGNCAQCAPSAHCASNTDCSSQLCVAGSCAEPTCSDNVRNGSETDVDCGGACLACPTGSTCSIHTDCGSRYCHESICTEPRCDDLIQNGTESDLDCGGPCATCSLGRGCVSDTDCESSLCYFDRCASGEIQVSAGRVFETGTGPLVPLNGAQLYPGGPEELVVANMGEGNFGMLSGNVPNGGFTSLERFTSPTRTIPRAVGDFDDDGQAELLLGLDGSTRDYRDIFYETWRLSRVEDGGLTTLSEWDDSMMYHAFADFDQDGWLDLAYLPSSGNSFYVRYGVGDGVFSPEREQFSHFRSSTQEVGTWFGVGQAGADSFPDIFVQHNPQYIAITKDSTLHRGLETGGFEEYPAQTLPVVIGIGDLESDGDSDILCAVQHPDGVDYPKLNYLLVGINDGAGDYSNLIPVPDASVTNAVLRDLDRDGVVELVSGDAEVRVWKFTGSSFELASTVDVGYSSFSDTLVYGDFDGNGLDDIVVNHRGRSPRPDLYLGANIAVFEQTSPLQFVSQQMPIGHRVEEFDAADFDGDGDEDIISVIAERVDQKGPRITYFENGQVVRTDEIAVDVEENIAEYGYSVRAANFNDDSLPDFVVDAADHTVVATNRGDGSFEVVADLQVAHRVRTLDLDADGLDELLFVVESKTVQIWGMDENGVFVQQSEETIASADGEIIERSLTADVDGDGLEDFIGVGYHSRDTHRGTHSEITYEHTSRVWVRYNRGNGQLNAGPTIDNHTFEFTADEQFQHAYFGAMGAAAGDFDGDGVRDLAVTYGEFYEVVLYFAAGPTHAAETHACYTLINPAGVISYDFNSDGRDDLAVQNLASAAVTLTLSTGPECPQFAGHYRTGSQSMEIGLAHTDPTGLPTIMTGGDRGLSLLPVRLLSD